MQKEAEQKIKDKNVGIKKQQMWNMKCVIIPIIFGDTGNLTKGLKKNLKAIPAKHSIDLLQKTVTYICKSHTVRKVL